MCMYARRGPKPVHTYVYYNDGMLVFQVLVYMYVDMYVCRIKLYIVASVGKHFQSAQNCNVLKITGIFRLNSKAT